VGAAGVGVGGAANSRIAAMAGSAADDEPENSAKKAKTVTSIARGHERRSSAPQDEEELCTDIASLRLPFFPLIEQHSCQEKMTEL